jgi:hypothetical protein
LRPDKSAPKYLKAGISIGVLTQWESALLTDLKSGMSWVISLKNNTVRAIENSVALRTVEKKIVMQTSDATKFSSLHQIKYLGENIFEASGGDPKMHIDIEIFDAHPHLVEIEMSSPEKGMAKLYYEINNEPYSELNVASAFLNIGQNNISFLLPKGVYKKKFRFDIGEEAGTYKFNSIKISALVFHDIPKQPRGLISELWHAIKLTYTAELNSKMP